MKKVDYEKMVGTLAIFGALLFDMQAEMEKVMVKNNSAAAKRLRIYSIRFEKIAKKYRLESMKLLREKRDERHSHKD